MLSNIFRRKSSFEAMFEASLQDNDDEVTSPYYWDCECEVDYIHSYKTSQCWKCGVRKHGQPNSIKIEVEKFGFQINPQKIFVVNGPLSGAR